MRELTVTELSFGGASVGNLHRVTADDERPPADAHFDYGPVSAEILARATAPIDPTTWTDLDA
ncbi:MAG TPA: hypothetical protein VGH43_04905 [Jatrophihabitans sp.]